MEELSEKFKTGEINEKQFKAGEIDENVVV